MIQIMSYIREVCCLNSLGTCYFVLAKYDDALKAFRMAIEKLMELKLHQNLPNAPEKRRDTFLEGYFLVNTVPNTKSDHFSLCNKTIEFFPDDFSFYSEDISILVGMISFNTAIVHHLIGLMTKKHSQLDLKHSTFYYNLVLDKLLGVDGIPGVGIELVVMASNNLAHVSCELNDFHKIRHHCEELEKLACNMPMFEQKYVINEENDIAKFALIFEKNMRNFLEAAD